MNIIGHFPSFWTNFVFMNSFLVYNCQNVRINRWNGSFNEQGRWDFHEKDCTIKLNFAIHLGLMCGYDPCYCCLRLIIASFIICGLYDYFLYCSSFPSLGVCWIVLNIIVQITKLGLHEFIIQLFYDGLFIE